MSNGLVQILDGNTFVVSDRAGDIEASLTDPTGLFSFDTRFLSRWVLTINGQRLNPLSTDDLQYFETRFFLVPGTGTVYVDAKLSVIRQRAVGGGFQETLTILNHDDVPIDLEVRIEAGSDFADLFEVKDALQKKGKYQNRVDGNRLILGYCARRSSVRRRSLRRLPRTSTSGASASRRRSRPTKNGRRRSTLRRRSPNSCRASTKPNSRAAGSEAARTCRRVSTSGSPRRRDSNATTMRSSVRIAARSSTWPRCDSRPRRCRVTTFRPRVCRGS